MSNALYSKVKESSEIIAHLKLVSKVVRFLLNSAMRFCLVGCLLRFTLVAWEAMFSFFKIGETVTRLKVIK